MITNECFRLSQQISYTAQYFVKLATFTSLVIPVGMATVCSTALYMCRLETWRHKAQDDAAWMSSWCLARDCDERYCAWIHHHEVSSLRPTRDLHGHFPAPFCPEIYSSANHCLVQSYDYISQWVWLYSVVVRALDLRSTSRNVRLQAAVLTGNKPWVSHTHICPAPLKLQPFGAIEIWLI